MNGIKKLLILYKTAIFSTSKLTVAVFYFFIVSILKSMLILKTTIKYGVCQITNEHKKTNKLKPNHKYPQQYL